MLKFLKKNFIVKSHAKVNNETFFNFKILLFKQTQTESLNKHKSLNKSQLKEKNFSPYN